MRNPAARRGRDGDGAVLSLTFGLQFEFSGGLGCIEENQVPTGCRYCEFGEFAMIPCHNALFRDNQLQELGVLTQKWQQIGKDATSLDWSPYDTFDTDKCQTTHHPSAQK